MMRDVDDDGYEPSDMIGHEGERRRREGEGGGGRRGVM